MTHDTVTIKHEMLADLQILIKEWGSRPETSFYLKSAALAALIDATANMYSCTIDECSGIEGEGALESVAFRTETIERIFGRLDRECAQRKE